MLVIQDLHKSFADVHALNGCSLSVDRGRMLGFLGPNGAGKTTAMRSIFGLIHPDSGSVSWDGHDIGRGDLVGFGYMESARLPFYRYVLMLPKNELSACSAVLEESVYMIGYLLNTFSGLVTTVAVGGRSLDDAIAESQFAEVLRT